MPLGRYFAGTGSVLLALLFLADWCFPKPPERPRYAEIDRSIIRIHSMQKWPDAITLNTNAFTVAGPVSVANDVPDIAPPKSARQAYAFLPSLPKPLKSYLTGRNPAHRNHLDKAPPALLQPQPAVATGPGRAGDCRKQRGGTPASVPSAECGIR